ncbi:hypothetical protein CVT26_006890 [Gymnopilus dilepis]|uniref:Uncharacterized protein n=1 Tax=Gymnopilus dilepis TaxID=231916 RepID=A0A409W103_9AGAR|nr:hypothetical protein CVT26_006890 [Gymnopilus dilepis]
MYVCPCRGRALLGSRCLHGLQAISSTSGFSPTSQVQKIQQQGQPRQDQWRNVLPGSAEFGCDEKRLHATAGSSVASSPPLPPSPCPPSSMRFRPAGPPPESRSPRHRLHHPSHNPHPSPLVGSTFGGNATQPPVFNSSQQDPVARVGVQHQQVPLENQHEYQYIQDLKRNSARKRPSSKRRHASKLGRSVSGGRKPNTSSRSAHPKPPVPPPPTRAAHPRPHPPPAPQTLPSTPKNMHDPLHYEYSPSDSPGLSPQIPPSDRPGFAFLPHPDVFLHSLATERHDGGDGRYRRVPSPPPPPSLPTAPHGPPRPTHSQSSPYQPSAQTPTPASRPVPTPMSSGKPKMPEELDLGLAVRKALAVRAKLEQERSQIQQERLQIHRDRVQLQVERESINKERYELRRGHDEMQRERALLAKESERWAKQIRVLGGIVAEKDRELEEERRRREVLGKRLEGVYRAILERAQGEVLDQAEAQALIGAGWGGAEKGATNANASIVVDTHASTTENVPLLDSHLDLHTTSFSLSPTRRKRKAEREPDAQTKRDVDTDVPASVGHPIVGGGNDEAAFISPRTPTSSSSKTSPSNKRARLTDKPPHCQTYRVIRTPGTSATQTTPTRPVNGDALANRSSAKTSGSALDPEPLPTKAGAHCGPSESMSSSPASSLSPADSRWTPITQDTSGTSITQTSTSSSATLQDSDHVAPSLSPHSQGNSLPSAPHASVAQGPPTSLITTVGQQSPDAAPAPARIPTPTPDSDDTNAPASPEEGPRPYFPSHGDTEAPTSASSSASSAPAVSDPDQGPPATPPSTPVTSFAIPNTYDVNSGPGPDPSTVTFLKLIADRVAFEMEEKFRAIWGEVVNEDGENGSEDKRKDLAFGRDSGKEHGDGKRLRLQCDLTEARDGMKHEDKSDSESDYGRSRGLPYVQSLSSPYSSYWGHTQS